MKRKTKLIPKGYHAVTPYLSVKGAADAIIFYKKAFGAKEIMRVPGPNGTIGHAEVQIGDSRIMLADEFPEMNFRSPRSVGGTPVTIHLYVQDADKVAQKALAAGAKLLRPVSDQFYGDRSGSLEDPFGHVWHVATHIEDIPTKELKKRAAAMASSAEKGYRSAPSRIVSTPRVEYYLTDKGKSLGRPRAEGVARMGARHL